MSFEFAVDMNGARFNIVGVAFDAYRIKCFLPELEAQSIEVFLFVHGLV
ncbi:hypothetical protein [Pseudomonas carnis]|nr:hypothetical protein [Pseudomonas carnis]MBY8953434.1 hypothetical protein [Pseudomonas carnis]